METIGTMETLDSVTGMKRKKQCEPCERILLQRNHTNQMHHTL